MDSQDFRGGALVAAIVLESALDHRFFQNLDRLLKKDIRAD